MAKVGWTAGHDVTVFNRTPGKMAALVAAGAKGAESLTDLARRSVVQSSVADRQVRTS